jgi:hypothetical protein
MPTTALKRLRAEDVCSGRYAVLAAAHPNMRNDDALPLRRILAGNGASDALRVFRAVPAEQEDEARQIATESVHLCAERALRRFEAAFLNDGRPRRAPVAARCVACGDKPDAARSAAAASSAADTRNNAESDWQNQTLANLLKEEK